MRYTKEIESNKVTVKSSYAGKPVVGVAKCHPNDSFDEEFGTKLAAARCNQKITKKRLNRSLREYKRAIEQLNAAQARVDKMLRYENDSFEAYRKACELVADLEAEGKAL